MEGFHRVSIWRQWDSWCIQWNLDPISAPLNLILEFLYMQYNSIKQYPHY